MDTNEFVLVVGALTFINNFLVQFIKNELTNKNTTLVALITGVILAFLGLYFKFYNFDIVATCVLGLTVGISSAVGYDKFKQCYDSIMALK